MIKRSPQNDRRTSILRNNVASFVNVPSFKSLWYNYIAQANDQVPNNQLAEKQTNYTIKASTRPLNLITTRICNT